jgi:hypothetical protein
MTGFELLAPQSGHVPGFGLLLCSFCLLCTWKTGFDLFWMEEIDLGIWYMLIGSALAASLLVLL